MLKDYTLEDLKKDCEELELDFEELSKKMENFDSGQWALFLHSGNDLLTVDDIALIDCGTDEIHFNGEDLLVLTDDEAESAWNDELDNYFNEVVLPEIPERYQNYIDYEKWYHDARFDGRGVLARYDGIENQYIIEYEDGERDFIFIYRQ